LGNVLDAPLAQDCPLDCMHEVTLQDAVKWTPLLRQVVKLHITGRCEGIGRRG
jgi:hypothetical protein